jgi:hypothetical protein
VYGVITDTMTLFLDTAGDVFHINGIRYEDDATDEGNGG